ncbi:hypothetical protein BKA81DRAFT_403138 [Phyllosticta paracitricarpa]|uniref:Uncharacterized protein n=1 Tax=Phyllosticta paracitricarpa TaxID=2016321 RepID=A0ABR1NE60_9PEZI
MSDEPFDRHLHPGAVQSRKLWRDTAELFRWRVGRDGLPEKRPDSIMDYRAQTQHNARSHLGGLPPQMMMNVGNRLPSVDRRSFLGSASAVRRNSRLIANDGPLKEREMWFYTRRILRDAYHHAVELEKAGKVFRDAVACAGCKETHPEYHFTESELHMIPEVRECKGRSGRFEVCEHVSLQWRDINLRCGQQIMRNECEHQDHFDHSPKSTKYVPWSQLKASGPTGSSPPLYQIMFHSRLALRDDGKLARTMDEWEALLLEKDRRTCPHTRLTDLIEALVSKYRQDNPYHVDFFGRPPYNARIKVVDGGVRWDCTRCKSSMELVQQETRSLDHPYPTFVKIKRLVVVPSRPNGNTWFSHLEF